MTKRIAALLLVLLAFGCGDDGPAAQPDAAPPAREVTGAVAIDASGVSEPFTFVVPPNTRGATIVVEGAPGELYALASLTTADGSEQVGIDLSSPPGPVMRASYDNEQIGQMPGNLYQSIRLGTFTHVYPYRPDQLLPEGETTLRVAATAAGTVNVTVYLPEDDGSAVLHVNLIAVSDTFTFPMTLAFENEVQTIFAQAGITVVIDDVIALTGTGLAAITDFTEPQETPGSMTAMLPALAAGQVAEAALDVFVVDSLPLGVAGLSLGTPGPPRRGSYYYGVVLVQIDLDAEFGRVLAHEVCHFLGLQHVQNVGISGTVYPDPLDDTTPGQGNLMESGTTLTADQAFSLSRSVLLRTD